MGATAERPGLLERYGSAVSSSNLAPNAERAMPIDLIGAAGLGQINPLGAAHTERESAKISPDTELGGVLVRLKIGGDRTLGNRAVYLLLAWVSAQKAYGKWKVRPGQNDLLERFVRQGLAEWLNPVCTECSGRQVLGMDRGEIRERRAKCVRCGGSGEVRRLRENGQPIPGAPRAHRSDGTPVARDMTVQCPACRGLCWVQRRKVVNTKPRTCHACQGTGVDRVSDAERASALGIDQNAYRKHWARRFNWLGAAFDRIEGMEKNSLRAQLTSG